MPRLPKADNSKSTPSPPDTDSDLSSRNEPVFSNWSTEECTRLIDYIKKNGFDGDVKKISEQFPGHTETNIRHFMAELGLRSAEEDSTIWKIAAKFEKLQELARENNLSQSYGSVLPTFVEWKALFENHPDPSTCGGVDYAEMYRAVASLMRGEIPRAINKPTAARFLKVFDGFLEKLKKLPELPVVQSYKKPATSAIKSKGECQETLKKRRSSNWTKGETSKAKLLLTGDLATVREVYLTPAWANPFRFPDERSRFRARKLQLRRLALERPLPQKAIEHKATKPRKKRRKRN